MRVVWELPLQWGEGFVGDAIADQFDDPSEHREFGLVLGQPIRTPAACGPPPANEVDYLQSSRHIYAAWPFTEQSAWLGAL